MALKETDWKRFFFDEGLEVQGTGALRRIENGETKEVKPQVGNLGRKFIYVNDRKTTVDYIVACCFCHKEPGQKFIRHKDGDVTNDNFKNLEWVYELPTATNHPTPPSASTYAHPFQFAKDKPKTDREDGDDSGNGGRPNFGSRKWDNKWTGRGNK